MPSLLTTSAIITCPHGGTGTTIPSAPIVSVAGGYVCTEADVGTLTCAFPVPCTGYTLRSMGLNSTYINGRRAILSTDFQQSLTGLPLSISDPNNAIDNSTPASLSPGATEEPLSPALVDESEPVVIATPPALVFSTTTMMPAAAAFVFTLSHPFPLEWTLTLLNGVMLTSIDLTTGTLVPPGLVVTPMGGSWASPTTAISVAMTAPFMAAMGPGAHHFYMTAISQRGISSFAEARLVVS